MPELKNVFHAGRMNKDLDERLIPNGEYRNALNVDVSFSESSDAGSAQNAYGNVVKSAINSSTARCIGSVVDKQKETIIWFVSDTSKDIIAEYNPITNEVVPILVDTNKLNDNSFLNFSAENLITGVNVIDDFLFFTDNSSEPKKINISRMKNGSTDFSTTTKYQNSDGTYTNNVYEELITVIKKYPLNAPKISLSNTTREGNVKGVSHTKGNTTYVKGSRTTIDQAESQDFLSKNIFATTAGGASIYNLTEDDFIERVCNNFVDDDGCNIISFETTGFTTGNDYKKWRAVEPGMVVAISENGSGTYTEPVRYHTVKTVDWLNHTITVNAKTIVTSPADGTKVRIFHWSTPFNNSYFWAYKDSSNNILKKPIGTSSDNYIDNNGNLLKDGGILNDGTGFDITLTGSDATSGTNQLQYGSGWSYNSGTKTYSYDGTGSGSVRYPKITKPTDLLAGHIYRMEVTITVTTAGTIGFLSKNSNLNQTTFNGLNGREARAFDVGTHEISITWKQAVSGNDGMLALFAQDNTVGTVKINEINCLTKPRPIKIQPIQFYGGTNYEVNDIIKLQAEDVNAVSFDSDKFVDITLKLTEKVQVRNNKVIPTTNDVVTSASLVGNEKIANGDFSDLTTWHTGTTGTTDIGTSAAAFFVSSGTLTSTSSAEGYVRNVLAEALVTGEYYKLTYTVTTASSGSSGNQGRLHLILATNDLQTANDSDYGHSNHLLLPTHATGTYNVYFKQRSHNSNSELMFFNDTDWAGAIDNVSVKKIEPTEVACGTIGTGTNRQMFEAEILSIDDSIIDNVSSLKFVSKRVQPDAIYEKEFARFSYRYKYIDNEYSAISPFTEVAFIPKNDEGYNYDSKLGYNKSMVNDLRKVTLSGVKEMPEDVKSIDLLYKKSNSTNVYILRTIEGSELDDLKSNDEIIITSEEIKSLLPENQMLRPYDNVPRKAKAQEITGNRLLYGNYLQQYNYFNTPVKFKVSLNSSEIGDVPLKSLKSIRDYQVGVVFLDNYGRQSPVFTNETGIIKLDQKKSETQNSIQCSLLSSPPSWATHFKYYIKDSSNEFYNLAMDRFYSDTEDENVWISFPSSEINKINENDYIAIKKEHDTENAVDVPAGSTIKYKVIDKKAEVPTHLRFKMEEVGSSTSSVTFSAGDVVDSSDSNSTINAKYLKQIYKYPTKGSSTFLISAFDLRVDTELLEEFNSYITNTGVWYDIDNRFFEIKSTLNGTVSKKYELTEIYKKTAVEKITGTTAQGVTSKGNVCVLISNTTNTTTSSVNFFNNGSTSQSGGTNVSAGIQVVKKGMRLVDNENSLTYKGKVIVVASVNTSNSSLVLSESISQVHNDELFFKDAVDMFYFKTKKPFGDDIRFIGDSPQATRIELLDIDPNSYNATNTVLPNPQDLKLQCNFYKQTTDDYGEEFKGKFFIQIKRDGFINEFIYKTQDSINTFKSRDSARLFYAQTWLLDQGNSDTIIPDTNLTTSTDYIRQLLDISTIPQSLYTNKNGGTSSAWDQSRKNFGLFDGTNTRRIAGTRNGNGLCLNPETLGGVAYAATLSINGANTRVKFGGTTRGVLNSSVYSQDMINGYSMKEINYDDPSNSGGATNPIICIDQSVGFKYNPGTVGRFLPYVGDGWQLGRTNCTFKITGVNSFAKTKGNLGILYNFYLYLTTVGQTFRFPNDPTNTVYTIRKSVVAPAKNSVVVKDDGSIVNTGVDDTSASFGPGKGKYYEHALVIDIQLDKGIVWSPLEETSNQSVAAITPLELSSNLYTSGKTFSSAEQKSNKEKTATSNSATFSACEIDFGEATISSDTPAVFEVLPKEKVDLNLFYETPLTRLIIRSGMSVKTSYRTADGDNPLANNAVIIKAKSNSKNKLDLFQIDTQHVLKTIPAGETITVFKKDQNNNVIYSQDIVLEKDILPHGNVGVTRSSGIMITDGLINNTVDVNKATLNYYNCFAFGNGVESNRIFDDFNAVTIDKGPRVSTILDTDYKEERKINGLIYSGIYNSKSSFNNLNQFIQGEKITKDLNPDYGSVQKLFTRNTNVIVLCEDKVLKVLASKDALFNADGNPQLTATNKVLGQVVPFVGEYGISQNPESFASYGYRCYFADKKRGAILRLSGDGITNIAEKGMSKFFRDNLDNSLEIKGSYDSLKDHYNVTLNNQTLSFTEKVNGWTSFKSFIPEDGISYSNSYFTFKLGEIYMHGENLTRNNFYGDQYDSTIDLVFNTEPDSVKTFKTITYEGDTGWVAETIKTDKESGSVPVFVEKEGKYFNFIQGAKINNDIDLLKTQALNVQGIGSPSAVNYNSNTSAAQHVVTAIDIAANKDPKKWIINNSASDTLSTSNTIKFYKEQGASITHNAVFYVHPQTVKGVPWKLDPNDFTFSYAESISNFNGTVTTALQTNGSIAVTIAISSSSFPTSRTTSTLTITAASAYQEQI